MVTSHDPAGGLAEADLALGLRDGRVGALRAGARRRRRRVEELYRVRRAVGALLRKDLLLELRTRESVPAMLLFSVTTFVALPLRARPRRRWPATSRPACCG